MIEQKSSSSSIWRAVIDKFKLLRKTSIFTVPFGDEIKDKTITSTWDEAYSNPMQVPVGLVTRTRAKKFKEALNGLIQATWAESNSWRLVEGVIHDKCMIQALEESLPWNRELACTLWRENILFSFFRYFPVSWGGY